MKATLAFSSITVLTILLLIGCGGNNKGPDPQVSPSSASGVTSQETPPPDQLQVDKEPYVLKKAEPKYPELALKAGLEGRVVVKIWVGADGTPKQVVILKSDSDIFNQPSIDAAKQFVFAPAYIKDKPVDVWVSLPFKYAIAEKQAQRPGATTGPASATEASFMKGYIAGKEGLLSDFEKIAASAREKGKPNRDVEQRIQKLKTEIPALKEALRAMQDGK